MWVGVWVCWGGIKGPGVRGGFTCVEQLFGEWYLWRMAGPCDRLIESREGKREREGGRGEEGIFSVNLNLSQLTQSPDKTSGSVMLGTLQ